MSDINQLLAPTGVSQQSMLAFFRGQNTSVAEDLKQAFLKWVDYQRSAGLSVDEEVVSRVMHDLEAHHRLTPETIQGMEHAPFVSLNHTEAEHFELG